MSTSLGNKLPDRLVKFLENENLKRKNSAIFLVTSDPEGYPHIALLSPYQVVIKDSRTLFIAVHKGTRSQKFLEHEGKATMIVQLQPAVEYIKFQIARADDWGSEKMDSLYVATPTEILEDYSDKAPFTSELEFDEKKIVDAYREGFHKMREYILKH